jgi:hypothetical protein
MIETFHSLQSMHTLNLSYNLIEIISERLFENNKKLKYLHLKSNKIFAIHEKSFKSLTELSSFDLSDNICINAWVSNKSMKALNSCFKFFDLKSRAKDHIVQMEQNLATIYAETVIVIILLVTITLFIILLRQRKQIFHSEIANGELNNPNNGEIPNTESPENPELFYAELDMKPSFTRYVKKDPVIYSEIQNN